MKTIGKIIAIFFTLTTLLISGVTINVEEQKVIKGENVIFSIEAIGSEVSFPEIKDIEGFLVNQIGQQNYTSIINGTTFTKVSKKYSFSPTKDLIIPSFDVTIDKKIEKTKEIKIEIIKAQQTKDANFKFDLIVNKKEAFIGEPIKLTLLFQRRANQKISNVNFIEPKMDGFWSKVISDDEKETNGDFITHKISYIIFAQKSGMLDINNAIIELGLIVRDKYSFATLLEKVEYKKIYSNDTQIKIKPLPNGINLFGNYVINLEVDKDKISQNSATNVICTIKGYGNIDDLPDIELNIPNVEIFKDKPKISTQIKNDKYYGEYIQKFAIVADENFTIAPITLSYFNGEKIVLKETKPINIEVIKNKNIAVNEVVLVKAKEINSTKQEENVITQKSSNREKTLFLIIGFLVGIISTIILSLFNNIRLKKGESQNSYSTLVKKTKTDKELLELLLPFINKSKEIDLVVKKLEENLYKGFNNKINKKLLATKIDNYIQKFNIN